MAGVESLLNGDRKWKPHPRQISERERKAKTQIKVCSEPSLWALRRADKLRRKDREKALSLLPGLQQTHKVTIDSS